MRDRTHGGRVVMEGDAETVLTGLVADHLMQQTAPGVFAGGKQIVRTAATTLPSGDKQLIFEFDDHSVMTITGQFVVNGHQPQGPGQDDVIDGEIVVEPPQLTEGS